ncbi:FAD-binding oxidoreductase [Roseomonas sp. M0104]|uniref:FAD-binding oxidoreductase n=1 Tax=Teichococcus coralli TaxID=2545983 RepID=A0A845B3L4_9PROT|nr:FAD-binding oxidoreductase [Pseudoroseomonas coralli]MXP62243.1 FAD-binding oxidoreductase [Pseudoroseomonas coralli]
MMHALIEALRAALDDAVLTDPADLVPYSRDWLGKREGRPSAVARPADAAAVAVVLRLCAEHGVGVVPQGGE